MIRDFLDYVEGLPRETYLQPTPFLITSLVVTAATLYYRATSSANAPVLIPKGAFEFSDRRIREKFLADPRQMLREWFNKHPNKPVQVVGDFGPMTILPGYFADEIRNDKRMKFGELNQILFHSHLSGFEAFRVGRNEDIVKQVVNGALTKQLNKVTEPLAEEASLALSDLLSEDPEWHDIHLRETILRLIARISSRVFLGSELCRNEEWLRVTREYTVTVFQAAEKLREWPWILRPFANMFMKLTKDNRTLIAEARRVIQPVLEKRRALKAEAKARGEDLQFNDAIDWFDRADGGNEVDQAMSQLILSVAAIHTTSDLTSQTLIEIMKHPEIIEPLRQEIVSVLETDGWAKTALYKMKLLDSVIKESQRIKPIAITSMHRMTSEKVVLSDGTVIPKGGVLAITAANMWDEKVHTNADEWDGYRFYKMRQDPAKQNQAHLVSTNPDHLAFGHGEHACPGRFFAANEVKVAIISMLLKYDMKLPEGVTPMTYAHGFSLASDPMMNLSVRRRESEIEI